MNTTATIFIATLAVVILGVGAWYMMNNNNEEEANAFEETNFEQADRSGAAEGGETRLRDEGYEPPTGLVIEDVTIGEGKTAGAGDTVAVRYTGRLEDGTVFDSTDAHGGEPLVFTLGAGQVIRGWDVGVSGMKVGSTRHLIIPPDLAYGSQGVGPIPPNATLIFDVELVSIVE